MRWLLGAIALASASCAEAQDRQGPPFHLVTGSVPMDKGPDGNSVILDAPEGLIVVDTGRHPGHVAKILAYAKARGRPIAAVVNTHWHMDHVQGNADIRAAHPGAQVYATNAVDGALATFLAKGVKGARQRLADPKTPPHRLPEIRRYLARMDDPDSVRPTRAVAQSGRMTIAGRELEVRVAPFAVTEADLWLYDPQAKLAIVGDLVVDIVPFMDTACADGWLKALDELGKSDFEILIPGHGPVMDRAAFRQWKSAFERFVECGRSDADKAQCVAGWERDAARFIPASHAAYVREAAAYYIDTRLRSSAEEQQRYCKPLKA